MACMGAIAPKFTFSAGHDFIGANYAGFYFMLTLMATERFDEFHLFVTSEAHRQAVESAVARVPALRGRRVRVFSELELSEQIQRADYEAFLVPSITASLSELAFLRQKYGARFRLLALMMTISYAGFERNLLQLLRSPLRDADVIFCCSEASFEVLVRLFQHIKHKFGLSTPINISMAVVPYAVETGAPASGDRDQACAALGLDPARHYMLSLGRLSVVDKFDLGSLLQAFRLARPQLGERWQLLIAGGVDDPGYLNMVKLQARGLGLEQHVQFLPNVTDEQKALLYRAAEIFLSPSDNIQESFGLTIVEAMAAGLPVIASDWDGCRESVLHDATGLLVPTYMPQLDALMPARYVHEEGLVHLLVAQSVVVDVPALATAMIRLGTNEPLRRRMGDAGRARASAQYSFKAVSAQIEAVLAYPLEEHAGDPQLDEHEPVERDLSPWGLFRNYPTRELRPDDRLQTTPFGSLAEMRLLPIFTFPELRYVALPEAMEPIRERCGTPQTLQSLLTGFEAPRERLLYTLHYMLKQGVLAVVPD